MLAFSSFLLLPLIGIAVWRIDAVRRMELGARIAVAGAAGAAIIGALLGAMSIVGVEWSRATVFPVVAVIIAISLRVARKPAASVTAAQEAYPLALAGIVVVLLLTVYGLLSARMSCGDLHFFWGPKAIHFHHDGGVSVAFLADRNNTAQNPGYPLLLPMLYSWSLALSREFSWWAAVLATALFLLGSVALVRGTANDDRGALLMAATLAYALAIGAAAGAAEPPLIFFETLTLVALLFVPEGRGQTLLAALGLAGAVMLKIEGATFTIAIVLALLIVRRSVRRTMLIAAPAALLVAAWVWFIKTNDILEYYRGAAMPLYLEVLPKTLKLLGSVASYELFWLPWIVPAVLVVLGPARRAAALPLVVAILTLGVAVFYYIHVPDPTWWILASAPRVLLTPLTALLIAAVAAWSSQTPASGGERGPVPIENV